MKYDANIFLKDDGNNDTRGNKNSSNKGIEKILIRILEVKKVIHSQFKQLPWKKKHSKFLIIFNCGNKKFKTRLGDKLKPSPQNENKVREKEDTDEIQGVSTRRAPSKPQKE